MPLPTDVSHAKVDGHTETALRVFQTFFKLEVDGIFGPKTKEVMTACRCGVSDVLDPVDLQVFGSWKHRDLTFCFGKQSTQLSADIFKAATIRAMTTWTNAGVGLSFTEVASDQNPDIFIEFRQANDPDHSMVGGVAAHADFPPGYSLIVKTTPLPLHFDDEEPRWADGAVIGALDVETIGLHELGHILGLKHSEVLGAVMYPIVYENGMNRKLAADDLRSIRNLYVS
ncbi:Matrixin-domain-containing protein [Dactylonectria estremocensis]|uniref:Matrixin-domain-containing protein n=1 Tax=Dactylonectria estremocensis TaxID=1079267 RepID=A0A9P9FIV5_9HYPO|nr:Matrixin-domain-containing protein [Dactylonectria estremocensis]